MSHFTKVATKINDLDVLCTALDRLGYAHTRGGRVRAWDGSEIDAAVKIGPPGTHYAIGVVPTAEATDGEVSYELVADWWGLETTLGRTQGEITDEIARAYALARVQLTCEADASMTRNGTKVGSGGGGRSGHAACYFVPHGEKTGTTTRVGLRGGREGPRGARRL